MGSQDKPLKDVRCRGKSGKLTVKSSWKKWKTDRKVVVQEKRKKLAKKLSLKKKEGKDKKKEGKSLISGKRICAINIITYLNVLTVPGTRKHICSTSRILSW